MSRAAAMLRALLAASALALGWLLLSLLLAAAPAQAEDAAPDPNGLTLVAGVAQAATGDASVLGGAVSEPVQTVGDTADTAASGVVTGIAEPAGVEPVTRLTEPAIAAGSAAVEALAAPVVATVTQVTSIVPVLAPVTSVLPDLSPVTSVVPGLLPELPATGSIPRPAVPAPADVILDPESVPAVQDPAAVEAPTAGADTAPAVAGMGQSSQEVQAAATAAVSTLPGAGAPAAPAAPPADRPEPATVPSSGGDSHSAPLAVLDARGGTDLDASGSDGAARDHIPSLIEEDHPSTPD